MVEENSEFKRDIHTIEQLRNDPELCFAFGVAKSKLEIPLESITRIAQEAYEVYTSIQCSDEEKTEFLFHLASGNFGIASSYIHKIASSKTRRSQDTKGSVARINSVDIRPNPVYSQASQAESGDYQIDSYSGHREWNEAGNLQIGGGQGMFGLMKEGKGHESERKDKKEHILQGSIKGYDIRNEDRIDRVNEEMAEKWYENSIGTKEIRISSPSVSNTPYNVLLWNKLTTPKPLSNYETVSQFQPITTTPHIPQNSPSTPQPMINPVINVPDKDSYSNKSPILSPYNPTYNLAFNPQAYLHNPSSYSPYIPSQATGHSESRSPSSEYNPQTSPSLAYNPPVQPQAYQNYQQPTSDLLITNPKGDSMSIDNPQPSESDQIPSQADIPTPPSHSLQPLKPMSLDANSSSSSSSMHPEEMKQENHNLYTFSSPVNCPIPTSPFPPSTFSPLKPQSPSIQPNPYPSYINTPPNNQFPIVKPLITPGCNMDEVKIKIEDTFREVESNPQTPEQNISMEYEFLNEQSSEVLKDIKLEESVVTEEPSSLNFNPTVLSYIEEEKTQPKATGPSVSDIGNVWDHLCYLCKKTLHSMEARTLQNCGHRFHNECFDNQMVEAQQYSYRCPIPGCLKMINEEAKERKEIQNLMKSEFIVCPGIKCGTTLVRQKDKGFVVCEECKNVVCLSCEKVHSDWYNCRHNLKTNS